VRWSPPRWMLGAGPTACRLLDLTRRVGGPFRKVTTPSLAPEHVRDRRNDDAACREDDGLYGVRRSRPEPCLSKNAPSPIWVFLEIAGRAAYVTAKRTIQEWQDIIKRYEGDPSRSLDTVTPRCRVRCRARIPRTKDLPQKRDDIAFIVERFAASPPASQFTCSLGSA
jgi:hypothetical protein